MTNENNLLRLWNLAEQWSKLADGWTQPHGYALAINEASRELKQILNSFENNSCDCTAGVEHIHLLD